MVYKTFVMIQSHYIQLEPPYRIIYAGGVMGLQIGTLLMVHDLGPLPRGGNRSSAKSRFITESYPVVSYTNKSSKRIITDIGESGLFSEGIVWDHVTQDKVATICLEGQKLSWDDCLDFLGPDLIPPHEWESLADELQRSYRNLKTFLLLGGRVILPICNGQRHSKDYNKHQNIIKIKLSHKLKHLDERGEERSCFRSCLGETITFFTSASDIDEAFTHLDQQRIFYQNVLRLFYEEYGRGGSILFTIPKDEVNDKELSRLIKRLNQLLEDQFPNKTNV